MILKLSPVQRVHMMTEPFSVMHFGFYNAVFIQSTDQDLTGKVCAGRLQRFVFRTVQLQWNAAAMPSSTPPCFAPNEHQSKAHSCSGTDHQVYTRKAMQLKATYFWTGKYFLCHCLVVGGGEWGGDQSRKEQLVEKNPRHATSGWADFLGRVTSRLLLGLPLLTARPSCLLTGGPR